MPDHVPDGRSRPCRPLHPLPLAGTAAAAVTVGAGLALAATSGPSRFPLPLAGLPGSLSAATPAPAPQPARPRCLRVVSPRRAGVLCRRAGRDGALHGALVRPKAGGGTVTIEIQSGGVTAVSRSSITLKSKDGFTRSYAMTSFTIVAARRDGIGSVKVGDQPRVTATASGGTPTATRIGDLSQLRLGLVIGPGRRVSTSFLPGEAVPPPRSAAVWPVAERR